MTNDPSLLAEETVPDVFPGIYLGNGELRAKLWPQTFQVPDADERSGLAVGDYAKLMFLARPTVAVADCSGERMWVEITERTATIPRRYIGKVANEAAYLPIPYHGLVTFGPEHVIDVLFEGEDEDDE